MIRSLLAIVLGVGLAAGAGLALTGDTVYLVLLIVCGCLVGPLIAGATIAYANRSVGEVPPAQLAEAVAAGRTGLARIVSINATGSSLNDQPVCAIDLLVVPSSGHPYTTVIKHLVNLAHMPSMQPGRVLVVAQLYPDRPEVAIVSSPDPGWAYKAEHDARVRELATANSWVVPAADKPPLYGRKHIPFVVFLGLAILAAAVTLVPAFPAIRDVAGGKPLDEVRAADDEQEAAAQEPRPLQPGGAQPAIDALVDLAGPQFFTISLYRDNIYAEGLTAPGALTSDTFRVWEKDKATREGPNSIQPDPADVPNALFDVADVDWSLVPGLLEQAAAKSGIAGDDEPTVLVRRSSTGVGPMTPPQFTIAVENEYYDAWFTFGPDGTLVDMYGGEPGSESYVAGGAG